MKKFLNPSRFSRLQKACSRFFDPIGNTQVIEKPHIKSPRGSALVMAAIFMLVAAYLITIGVKLVSNTAKQTKQEELYVGEAENVAKAGLVDSLGWFKRKNLLLLSGTVRAYDSNYLPGQTTHYDVNPATSSLYTFVDQPFNPVNNTANAQLSDTIDSTIGIVNEYPLDDSVTAKAVYWARYEVRKVNTLFPTVTPAATFDPYAAHDITGNRSVGVNGDGLIWNVVSTGYVYRRLSKAVTNGAWTVPYNVSPNKVVATARLASEYRKLGLNMPSTNIAVVSGGIYCESTTQVSLQNDNTLINGAVSGTGTFAVIGMTSR